MKAAEAAALLTIAAAYDNRKPDAEQARAWALALKGLRFEDCREVVVQHYRRSREWLMPVDVIEGVKRVRSKRIAEFGPIPAPDFIDPDAADFGEQYKRYMIEVTKAIGDGTFVHPANVLPGELTCHDVIAELGQAKSVDAALAIRPLREAHAEAKRELLAAKAEREREKAEHRANREAARATTRAAVNPPQENR